jgi:cell wall-associated NlpC family hydrolase
MSDDVVSDERWIDLINYLVGKPFSWNSRGPDSYDCWGLVLEVRRAIGLPVPHEWSTWMTEIAECSVEASAMMEEQLALPLGPWLRVNVPEPGDIVAMSSHKKIHHVGVCTPYGVLNTTRQLGTTLCSFERLRDMGYKRIEFYRWVG